MNITIPEKKRSISAPLPIKSKEINNVFKLLSLEDPLPSGSQVVSSLDVTSQKGSAVVVTQGNVETEDVVALIKPELVHVINEVVSEELTRSIEESITAIVGEVMAISPGPTTKGLCSVCQSPDEVLVYTCDKEIKDNKSPCSGALCLDCMKSLVTTTIDNALYCIPTIRCPGRCFSSIPTAVWRGHLTYELENEEYVEEELVERYERNASTLLSIRCGSCDETNKIAYSSESVCTSSKEREGLLRSFLSYGVAFEGKLEMQEKILHEWVKFMKGEESADVLVRDMITYLDTCDYPENEKSDDDDDYILTIDADRCLRQHVLPLMLDIERRAKFQLTVSREYPKFYTSCCQYAHCFACKVDNWHAGISCEEKQREELYIEAQFCPSCNIPTIRTEGCSDMLCVCNEVWSWDGDDNDDDYY